MQVGGAYKIFQRTAGSLLDLGSFMLVTSFQHQMLPALQKLCDCFFAWGSGIEEWWEALRNFSGLNFPETKIRSLLPCRTQEGN